MYAHHSLYIDRTEQMQTTIEKKSHITNGKEDFTSSQATASTRPSF